MLASAILCVSSFFFTALPRFCGGVDELGREALAHRLLAAVARVRRRASACRAPAALGADVDGDLVGRATDAAALHLELRLHVVERLPEDLERIFLEALGDDVERAVEDALGGRLLAVDS